MAHETIALLAVIVLQQLFYMRQVQKLVDKLMSRNYAEYSQSEKFQKTEPRVNINQFEEPLEDINRVLG